MAKIGEISGASIKVNPNDHPPPHVHIFYQGSEVRLNILTAEPLDDVPNFPRRILKDAKDWLLDNRITAAEKWAEYHD